MEERNLTRQPPNARLYDHVGDYSLITEHAHLIDDMYFRGKHKDGYVREASFIETVIGSTSGNTFVDAGCGTGIHLGLLHERGLSVSGFDLRSEMVAVAAKNNPGLRIVVGDMREYPFEERVNGISALYGAINYLESEAEIRSALRGFANHLTDDGVAIIDTRYQPNLDEEVHTWATDSWILAKRWVKKKSERMESAYRVFYALPEHGVMEMEDHRQYFQDPFWIAERMEEEGFARTTIYDSYDLDTIFDPSSGSYKPVIVAHKQA